MNTDHCAGSRHGKFPAEELLTKVMLIAQVEVRHRMAVGFQRRYLAIECVIFIFFESQVNEESIVAISFGSSQVFIGHRHDPLAIFARALGDELLRPRGKSSQRRRAKKCDFVPFYSVNSPKAAPRIRPGLSESATLAPQAWDMRRARARISPTSTPIKAAGTKPKTVNAE